MLELFYMGGPLFMGVLSVFLLLIIAGIIYTLRSRSKEKLNARLKQIKYVGILALTFGILGQVLGLYQAFSYLGEVGSVKPQVMYSGLKVSTIPTMYGMMIYIISLVPLITMKCLHAWKK
ncbi:MotA/TolQ/ExbB proton channel family protein [Plebeiibacterium sediminum]|uniref:MotA/TolQ/ExbB proton channel family protein n=1 Tax=Plebeiibacterium sediminum TaxID=2992112 RepID=A0AAE3SI76_9BACT|nr:MotA/TolQ/ExbB proton channel family protein [Plebeiobacterium sediminum]MCW3788898.1 MotA/TolQ/ExbB proton channel family protein [Plebeiobacterium sediminum]